MAKQTNPRALRDQQKTNTHSDAIISDGAAYVPYGDEEGVPEAFANDDSAFNDVPYEDMIGDASDADGMDERVAKGVFDVDTLTTKELGNIGELVAAAYLGQRGYEILEHNYRCPEGEADLIAYDVTDEAVVLVEVKTRRVHIFDELEPEASVDARKRARYRRIAACYLMDHFPVMAMRFDVVSVQLKQGQDARIEHFYDIFAWEAER